MEGAPESNSKFTPIKPHFFKPLLPGFLCGILIPVAFFNHYLNHHGKSKNGDIAVLRTVLGKWKVMIKDGRFEGNSWRDFADHHCLHVGDMVVFRHEGGLLFDVMVFDSSACERVYDHQQPPQLLNVKQESSPQQSTDDDLHRSKKAMVSKVKKQLQSQASNCFTLTVTKSSILRSYLRIPNHFVRLHGLKESCQMMVKDPNDRLWTVWLKYDELQKRSFLYRGWRAVVLGNKIKPGECIKLELVRGGESLMLKLTLCGSNKDTAPHVKIKEPMKLKYCFISQGSHCFISTVTEASIKYSYLFIPMGFARSNDLCDRRCEMLILDDSERKSWQVKLSHKSGRVYMGGDGFRAVVAENGLRAGDDISFELISGGTNPVMVFHALPRPSSHRSKRATATHPEAKKEAMKLPSHTRQCLKVKKEIMKPRSSQSSNYFISTVTRASIVKSFLYIPRQFARWHCLNKCRNMTIEDPRERLWPVSLRYWTDRLRVTRGWKAIALANELKDGQEIKLELVKEGKTLMMKFSLCGSEAVGIGLGKEEAECSLSLRDGHRSETLAGVLFPVSEVAAATHPVPPPLSNAYQLDSFSHPSPG